MPDWLTRAAQRRPDAVALEHAGERMTYADLHARAEAAEPGPFIEPPPGLDFAVALHACVLRDVPAVPLDPRHTDAERAARRTAPPPGTLLTVHTSGTTSAPKPVHLTAAQVHANALGCAVALGHEADERWLCALPLSHVGGLMILMRSAIYATTAIVERFDPARIAARLMAGDATLVSLVPTMLARLLDAGLREPPALRLVLLGGAPIPPALLERAAAAGVPVAGTYGLTEACSTVTVGAPGDPTAGWPIPGLDLAIAADGEILVGGLATGDLGALDARGRLTVTGRKADTIVTGGENVAPAEVEAALAAHPAVADAAVVGRPDPEWGERVVALVVPAPGQGVDPDALRAFCRERLAPYKVPRAFEPATELPRTPSGKLLRRAL